MGIRKPEAPPAPEARKVSGKPPPKPGSSPSKKRWWQFWRDELDEARVDASEEALRRLRSFRDIGETFQFCGVEMRVTSHHTLEPIGGYRLGILPRLGCNYVTSLGEIKVHYFYPKDLPMLEAENEGRDG